MKPFWKVLCVVVVIWGVAIGASILTGCIKTSISQPENDQITDLAISIAAKSLGAQLKKKGFTWDDEKEQLYKLLIGQNTLSIQTANLAQEVIKKQFDPLLHDDIMRLAKMIGVEFAVDNHILSTTNVNMTYLKTAADGLRFAIKGF